MESLSYQSLLALAAKPQYQVNHNGDIRNRHHYLYRRYMLRQFIDFQRDQRARADDREVLRPTLSQQQTRSFRQKQPSVDERAHAQ